MEKEQFSSLAFRFQTTRSNKARPPTVATKTECPQTSFPMTLSLTTTSSAEIELF